MSKRKRVTIPPLEVDLIPVLSCMFLLIPALLLAMEAANWASIPVHPPRSVAAGAPEDSDIDEPRLLRVQVREDGFALSLGRCESCEPEQIVARSGADGLEGLRGAALSIKGAHPSLATVALSAEATVSLQALVEVMDVLRGDGCSLSPDSDRRSCLFPGVVIDA